jgi:hypothetical protein
VTLYKSCTEAGLSRVLQSCSRTLTAGDYLKFAQGSDRSLRIWHFSAWFPTMLVILP